MGDEKKDIMREYLSSLNVPADIAEIYVTLKLNGPQTLSALSRLTKIERTKLYRLIDGMLDSNLFEIETESKRNLVSAAPVENLQLLVQKKIDEANSAQKQFNSIKELFNSTQLKAGNAKIRIYNGTEGIKQLKLKQLRAKKPDALTIVNSPVSSVVGVEFFSKWISTANQKNIKFKLLFNNNFKELSSLWRKNHQKYDIPKFKDAETKLIYPFQFKIETNIDIWDDTVVFYNWDNPDDIHAIEIESKEIASIHRQNFEMLWNTVKPT
jgi:sugar-specific transcriptional regulator TrmB